MHRRTSLVFLILVSMLLQGCTAAPVRPDDSAASEMHGSRQVSTCGYEVRFHRGSDRLGPSARSVLARAVAAFGQRDSEHPLLLVARASHREGVKVLAERRRTLVNALERMGIQESNLRVVTAFPPMDAPDDVPENFSALLRVCGVLSRDQLGALPEPSPTASRPVLVGNVRFDIPLSLLPREDWVDIPLEPEPTHRLALMLTWPGLHRSSEYRRCEHQACDESIDVQIRRPPLIGRDPGLVAAPWSVSDLQRIPGQWNGLRFFARPNANQPARFFYFTSTHESPPVSGTCLIRQALPYPMTAMDIGRALLYGQSCQLTPFFGPADVTVEIKIHGRYMVDWRAIRQSTEQFVTDLRPASAD